MRSFSRSLIKKYRNQKKSTKGLIFDRDFHVTMSRHVLNREIFVIAWLGLQLWKRFRRSSRTNSIQKIEATNHVQEKIKASIWYTN